MRAAPAQGNGHPLAVHVHQLDVAAVGRELGPDFLVNGLEHLLHALHVGHARLGLEFGQRLLLELGGENFGDLVQAFATGAPGLGIVGDFLHGLQIVLADGADDLGVRDAEALADQLALFMGVGHGRLALPLADGRLKGFLAHDRTVHLLLGQAAQGIGDVLVGQLERLVHRHALDHVREHGAGGDGAGAAESFKTGVLDDALVIDFQIELERVAAGQAAHLAHGVGVGQGARVVRVQKMIMHGFAIIPHNCLLKRNAFQIL